MRKWLYALALMLGMAGLASYANYTATVGSGTTFNSFDVGGVKAPGMVMTDAATGATDVGAALLAAVQAVIPENGSSTRGSVIGYTSPDPCAQANKTNATISFQTTTLTQQIAASGSNKIYICSLSLIASAATVFSISGGTGSNCASNQLGILGVAGSATHGLSLAANGGLTLGSGSGTVAVTAASSEICLVQSGAGDLSGNITYVYAP